MYSWDVIDILFAVMVASLPALNSTFDEGIAQLKRLAASIDKVMPARSGGFSVFQSSAEATPEIDPKATEKGGSTKNWTAEFAMARSSSEVRCPAKSDGKERPHTALNDDVELQRFAQ